MSDRKSPPPLPSSSLPPAQVLPVLPLRHMVLFPGVVAPVEVGRPSSLRLVEEGVKTSPFHLGLVAQREARQDDPTIDDLHPVGVVAEVLRVIRPSERQATLVVRGLERCTVGAAVQLSPYLTAELHPVVEIAGNPAEAELLHARVRETAKELISLSPDIPNEAGRMLDGIRVPSRMADAAASALPDLSVDERVALLAEVDVKARLTHVLQLLQHRLEVLRVKHDIDHHVREQIARSQKEVVLRQKLRAIQEELGEDDPQEGGDLEERIGKAKMPPEVEKVARKQLARLKSIPAASPEHMVARSYVEWLVDLPWSFSTPDHLDLEAARHTLDGDHYGLERVKKRILEYLAVRKLAPHKKGPILCLVGPPGVGKTSLGQSIARAMGRKFVRISLGGIHDEAEVRGHRRTYVGALPGRIIQGMKRAGSHNPIFMLDEVDKIGADYRGDPSSALLEVLDPEQNNSFSDHYLEVPFDLSSVIFIATANTLDPVPAPLLDRMEVLELPGYTRDEKLHIARRHLVPKQLEEHGLSAAQADISDGAVEEIIDRYTREAGVRNLERELASVVRGAAVKIASDEAAAVTVGGSDIASYLGPARFLREAAERSEAPGIATGLASTPSGGDLLFVEARRMPGKGNVVLTGQVGAVMKESAWAALSYVRTHSTELGVDPGFLERSDIHLHMPAGAVPKDGPSAGGTILVALVSLLTGRKARGEVASTAEITLRGRVLPVAHVKEKVLAAHRSGIKVVVLPERNRKDLVDVPAELLAALDLRLITRVDALLDAALEPPLPPAPPAPDGEDLAAVG